MSDATSDPLPYTQLDRAVKPTAARLAEKLGISYQHALGGLAEFWELCGVPRDLEKLLDQGIREVVLTRDAVIAAFSMGMGIDVSAVPPEGMVVFGLLEQRPDGFRVRGMSRYFRVIESRRVKRLAGAAGGRKSAQTRAERYGTAQPRSAAASESASVAASSGAPQTTFALEAEPEAPPKQRRTQRTADSGQVKADQRPNADRVWEEITELYEEAIGDPPPVTEKQDRRQRIHTLLQQMGTPTDPKPLYRVIWACLKRYPPFLNARNPIAYLQDLWKDPERKAEVQGHIAAIEAEERTAA